MGETRARDVQHDATASGADPRRRAPSDLEPPAGEMQQLEQERFSFGMGDRVRSHATHACARRFVRPEQGLSRGVRRHAPRAPRGARGRFAEGRAPSSGSRSRPSAVNAECAAGTDSPASRTEAPIVLSTLRSSAWAQTAPNRPVLAPMTATRLCRRTFAAYGRDAQSSAFFSAPGTEALYSGVAISMASARSISARSAATGLGAGVMSMSSSYAGRSASPRQTTNSTSVGHSAAAASSSAAL